MDYDDIDYDEGYSMRDIDNNWLNSNMDYETDSNFLLIMSNKLLLCLSVCQLILCPVNVLQLFVLLL